MIPNQKQVDAAADFMTYFTAPPSRGRRIWYALLVLLRLRKSPDQVRAEILARHRVDTRKV